MTVSIFRETPEPEDVRSPKPDWFPLAKRNLWRNPFGELTAEERGELAVVDLRPGLRFLCEEASASGGHRRAIQVIGDCGRGKSSYLLAALAVFQSRRPAPPGCTFPGGWSGAPYVYLPEDPPRPKIPWHPGMVHIIDEAQRMSLWTRRRVFSTGEPLLMSTHVDLTAPLERNHYRVLTIPVGQANSIEHVMRVMNRRVLASADPSASSIPLVPKSKIAELVRKFGTDIRAIESALYEEYANGTE